MPVPLVDLDDREADTDDEVDNLLSQPNLSVDDNVYANYVNTKIPVETLGAHIKDKDFKQEYLVRFRHCLLIYLLKPHQRATWFYGRYVAECREIVEIKYNNNIINNKIIIIIMSCDSSTWMGVL